MHLADTFIKSDTPFHSYIPKEMRPFLFLCRQKRLKQSVITAAIKALYSRDNIYINVVFYIFYKLVVLLEPMIF